MEQNTQFNAPESNQTSGNGKNQKKADAFIGNVRILDASGNEHPYANAFMPLNTDKNQLERSLVQVARERAKAGEDTLEITIKARVNLAKVDDGTTLSF